MARSAGPTTPAVDPGTDEVPVEPPAVQGVRGHLLCARGEHHGVDSVAIWHVSADGTPCGAWVWPWPDTAQDARRAVSLIDGRLLVDVDPDAAVSVIAALAGLAGIADPATTRNRVRAVTPAWLLEEVAALHAELRKAFDEAAAERVAARGSKLVPLDFPPLPDRLTGGLPAQLASLGLAPPPGVSPVIATALGGANLVVRLVQSWQEAEAQRMRRSYLRTGLEARPLSGAWVGALREANSRLLIQP